MVHEKQILPEMFESIFTPLLLRKLNNFLNQNIIKTFVYEKQILPEMFKSIFKELPGLLQIA